jgi:hypothetical protein
VRRVLGVIMLTAVAGTIVPATAVAATTLSTSQSPQRFGVRLVDVPVSEAHNPRGLRYIIDFLRPGMVISRRILVMNQESKQAHLSVYPDAAHIKNGYFIGDAGHARSELTGWITVQHPSVNLRPGASIMDRITIRVPRLATRGEHYGVIWVQQTARVHGRGVGVTEVARAGIRIYLAIGRGGAPPTKFAVNSIAGHRSPKGRLYLTALVHNTGGRAVDLSGTMRLTNGPGGTTAGPFSAQQVITLAPGQSDSMTFVPPRRLPIGPWRAEIKLVSGLTVERASATIIFANHPPSTSWLQPVTLIWVSGTVALLLLVGWLALRLRRPRGLRAVPMHALRAR